VQVNVYHMNVDQLDVLVKQVRVELIRTQTYVIMSVFHLIVQDKDV